MAAKKKYVVTGPLACVKDERGAVQYLYKGTPVPDYVQGDALQDLVATGLVGSDEDLITQPADEEPAK